MAKIDDVISVIENEIETNKILKEVTHVGLSIESTGLLKKKSIKILGRVNKQSELDEINRIILSEAKGLNVINKLRVESRS